MRFTAINVSCKSVNSRGLTAPGRDWRKLRTFRGLLAPGYLLVCLFTLGCQQKMADQPSYKNFEECEFFADGRSERPAVQGTVARGHLPTDVELLTGRRAGKDGEPMRTMPAKAPPEPNTPEAKMAEKIQLDQFADAFPWPMTETVLEHGRDRYTIYCVMCHDPLGTGQGKIVERGYTAPPSYHIKRLRDAPVGYLFAVVSEGYGSMPSYGAQIPVRDRWAIVGYLRALQASQHFPEATQVSPRPLGEGQGVRAAATGDVRPHPSPLPAGEGTGQEKAASGGQSP
jgi:hypothetical protein